MNHTNHAYRQTSSAFIENLLNKLQIDYAHIGEMQTGYRNKSFAIELKDGSKINLILYKNEPEILERIQRINLLTYELKNSGLPVRFPIKVNDRGFIFKIKSINRNKETHPVLRTPLSRGDVKLKTQNPEHFGCFYNYLPGKTIEWEHYTRKHIKLLGWAMAELHAAMRNNSPIPTKLGSPPLVKRGIKGAFFPIFADEMRSQIARMQKYFSDHHVLSAISHKLGIRTSNFQLLSSNFQSLCNHISKLDSQILHLDFVRGNILFNDPMTRTPNPNETRNAQLVTDQLNNRDADNRKLITDNLELSGILDFEKAAIGPTIIDIARTLSFLIADCSKYSEKQIIKYFIDSGYVKRGGGEVQYIKLLKPLMQYFWFYDFYKFLKHNPYESLKDNYHYNRTRQQLNNLLT